MKFEKLIKAVADHALTRNFRENVKEKPIKTVGGLAAMAAAATLGAQAAEHMDSPLMTEASPAASSSEASNSAAGGQQ